MSADKTIYAVWKQNHHHNDTDDDGFCDDDNECMHVKDTEGYCTVSGCKHPSSCCPKRSSGPSFKISSVRILSQSPVRPSRMNIMTELMAF